MKPRSDRWVVFAGIALGVAALFAFAAPAHAASGAPVWQRAYNGTGNGADFFTALAPAPKGGVYVVGTTTTTANYDFVAARYDAAGQQHWLHTYNGPDNGNDEVVSAASDRSGDLVMGGLVTTSAAILVPAIVKYGPDGHQRWVRIHNVQTGFTDWQPLAVDPKGNVYFAGSEQTSTSNDLVVIKYSASGALRWTRRYTGVNPIAASSVALDGAGNVYVTGFDDRGASHGQDVLTIKYDPAGNRRWVRLWDGAGLADEGLALAVTKSGTAYVGGFTNGATSGQNALLLEYTSGGALRWSRTYTSAGANPDLYRSVVALAGGGVAAAGASSSGTPVNDVLIARYAADGARRWARRYDAPGSLDNQGSEVARGRADAIYVAGETTAVATGEDSLLLKYSAAGALRWVRAYSSAGTANDYALALATVPGKSVYVAGAQAAPSVSDGLLLRYTP